MQVNVADSSGAASAAASFFSTLSDGLAAVNQDLWPDDDRRMQELAEKRHELRKELTSLGSGEHTGIISLLVGKNSEFLNVSRALDATTKEMTEIQNRRKTQTLEEQAAGKAADAHNAAREKELLAVKAASDAKKLERIQGHGAAALAAMDMQYASEDEKAQLNLQKNLDRINAWQLSQQEIEARGFETMTELKQSYSDLAYEKLNTDL